MCFRIGTNSYDYVNRLVLFPSYAKIWNLSSSHIKKFLLNESRQMELHQTFKFPILNEDDMVKFKNIICVSGWSWSVESGNNEIQCNVIMHWQTDLEVLHSFVYLAHNVICFPVEMLSYLHFPAFG